MKGHAGIEGNEEADTRAKEGKDKETPYIQELDLPKIEMNTGETIKALTLQKKHHTISTKWKNTI